MSLVFALAAAALFGTGAYVLLSRDLVRVVLGLVLISHASVLTLIAAGVSRGRAPIYPLRGTVGDPLTQAMALTALVIGLAVTALLLVLLQRVAVTYRTRNLRELAEHEFELTARLEREETPLREEDPGW